MDNQQNKNNCPGYNGPCKNQNQNQNQEPCCNQNKAKKQDKNCKNKHQNNY